MPQMKGFPYLTFLPTIPTIHERVSLRLGTLIISIYSVLHSILAGYNGDYLRLRELMINWNGIFFTAFAVFSLVLLYAVLLEKQEMVLLWLWYTIIMIIPMFVVLVYITNLHNHMKSVYFAGNVCSCIFHLPLFAAIVVVHSYRLEIELIDDEPEK